VPRRAPAIAFGATAFRSPPQGAARPDPYAFRS